MAYYSEDKRRYECIKEITKALRKQFKGIQSNSYGFCCTSDYDYHHKYINNDDYVCAKVYKGGLNNDYNYDEACFEIWHNIAFMWTLTTFKLEEVCDCMEKVAATYNAKIERPENGSKCIMLHFNKED